jgi:Fungal specific transcription factor domain
MTDLTPPMEPTAAASGINDINTSSAALLLQLSAYGGGQQQTAAVSPVSYSLHPTHPQYPAVQTQPGQFLHFPGGAMTMTADAGPARMHFSERERQVKRRTKTGCMTCRKRRIKVLPSAYFVYAHPQCDEGKPTCQNCHKSRRDCEGYQQQNDKRESTTPPSFASYVGNEYATPTSTLPVSNPSFSPINQRRMPLTPSPRFSPYDLFSRSPPQQNFAKEFDLSTSGTEFVHPDMAPDFPDLSSVPTHEDLSTPPPTARISIDSLLNLSSAALIHPPIDAPLNALFSPTTNVLPSALSKPYNSILFAHWISVLSHAMGILDRFPTDAAILESTPGVVSPRPRVPHEDSVYSFLIPHLAMAASGTGVLHATLACAASHRRERIYGMKHYHLAVRAIQEDQVKGTEYFVAVVLLGMYEVLGGKSIRCMYLARDWLLEHKEELKASMAKQDGEVTVRDVIIENLKWVFGRTAVHRGLTSLPTVTSSREMFIIPLQEFRELYIPREGTDSTVGVADSLVLLLAQVLSLPTTGAPELKAMIAHQLSVWPLTLARPFREQWTSQSPISTTSLNAIHYLHPAVAAAHSLHRAGIIYFSIYFNFGLSKSSPWPEAIAAAKDVLRITQPLIDGAASTNGSVLGALTLAFSPVFVAGQFLKFHLRDTPFLLPDMDWLDENLGEIVQTEEDIELREVERMIERMKEFLGGVEGRVVEL